MPQQEQDTIHEKLTQFVIYNFMVSADEIDMDESLIDQAIIDSFGLIELTAFIEKEFALVIREQDMTREAFGSMNKMAHFIAQRLQEREDG